MFLGELCAWIQYWRCYWQGGRQRRHWYVFSDCFSIIGLVVIVFALCLHGKLVHGLVLIDGRWFQVNGLVFVCRLRCQLWLLQSERLLQTVFRRVCWVLICFPSKKKKNKQFVSCCKSWFGIASWIFLLQCSWTFVFTIRFIFIRILSRQMSYACKSTWRTDIRLCFRKPASNYTHWCAWFLLVRVFIHFYFFVRVFCFFVELFYARVWTYILLLSVHFFLSISIIFQTYNQYTVCCHLRH